MGGIVQHGIVQEKMNRTVTLLAVASMALLAACGAWKPEKLEATTAEAIDSRLPAQMALVDFRSEFPDAVLVDGSEADGTWLVHVQQICFRCRTAHGFRRSEDVYARVVHFEGGRLARIEAAGAVQ